MSEDLLYRRDLLRLAADTSGAGHLPSPHAVATLRNPTCGDQVTVEIALADGRITELVHDTKACVLTQAAATLLARQAPGRQRSQLASLAADVTEMLQGGLPVSGYEAFAGVADHPGRHVCVLLPLQAVLKALED